MISLVTEILNLTVKPGRYSTASRLKQGTNDPEDDSLVTVVELNQKVKWELDPDPDSGRNTDITLENVKASDSTKPKYNKSQQILVI